MGNRESTDRYITGDGTRWVVNAYLLALAATFALGGRLAGVLGPRRLVTIGVIGFASASALCGATRVVLYGMAIALFITFLMARIHPGGRAATAVADEQQAAGGLIEAETR